MNTAYHPRVAVVSVNPIRKDQSNGILIRSLFKDWPKENLSQISFAVPGTKLPDEAICHEYRIIRFSGRTQAISGESISDKSVASPPSSVRRDDAGQITRRLRKFIVGQPKLMGIIRCGLETWCTQSHIGKVLERQLHELQPQIVYAQLGNYYLTRITLLACQKLGIPLYIHITDDFVTSLYQDIAFSKSTSAASELWMRRAVEHANGLAAISPVMAEQFAIRYGKSWDWFTTLVSAKNYDPTPRQEDGILRLVYAGSLEPQRWKTLALLAKSLRQGNQSGSHKAVLEIYGTPAQIAQHRNALDIPGVTVLRGWAAPEQLPTVFHDADILVHVESFESAVANYTKLSFSTKLSQYMMAGRPILAIGPADLGSMEMIRRAQAGFTICHQNTTQFQTDLESYLDDPAQRSRHGQQGRAWAMRWVDEVEGRERFRRNLLQSIASSGQRNSAA